MYQHVLIPTDDSDGARNAAEHGIEIAAAFDATVHALSVIEGSGAAQRDQLRTDPEDLAREAVEYIEKQARSDDLDVETSTPSGVPGETILGYIEDNDIDVVVMGTHGRTGLGKVVFGSIAEEVVRNSSVPVVTVKPQE